MTGQDKAARPVFNPRAPSVYCASNGSDHVWSYLGAPTNPTCLNCHRDFVNLALATLAQRVNRIEERLWQDNTDSSISP